VAEVRNLWKKAAPEIEAYSKYLQLLRKVELDSGRWIPQESGREYKAINSMCQGTARDALMVRLVQLSARMDIFLIATLHDEILFDVPKDQLSFVIPQIVSVMEQGYCGIPTPTDVEIYEESWGSEGVPWDEYKA
jgi:DNA polymerase I-like protein with 3'-5' exonuclease and polymerase domains